MKKDIIKLKVNIKAECKQRGLRIDSLCTSLGRNRSYIAHLINPGFKTIIDIARAIGCTPADLLAGIE